MLRANISEKDHVIYCSLEAELAAHFVFPIILAAMLP